MLEIQNSKLSSLLDMIKEMSSKYEEIDFANNISYLDRINRCYNSIRQNAMLSIDKLETIERIINENRSKNTLRRKKNILINSYIYNMQEEIRDFFLRYGSCLLMENDLSGALEVFSNLLKIEPDNRIVHDIVKNVTYKRNKKKVIDAFIKRYKLKYVKSFGMKILKEPLDLIYSKNSKSILVADHFNRNILKFNIDGEYLESIYLDLHKPFGLFRGERSTFWVCDWGNCTLKQFDDYGRQLKQIHIPEIFSGKDKCIHPLRGINWEKSFYIIITDGNFENRKLIFFDEKKCETLDISNVQSINDIKLFQGTVFINDALSCLMYYDTKKKRFASFKPYLIPTATHCASFIDNSIFHICNSGNALLKVSSEGEVIFCRNNMNEIVSSSKVQLVAVDSIEEDGINYLALSDIGNKCVHLFEI